MGNAVHPLSRTDASLRVSFVNIFPPHAAGRRRLMSQAALAAVILAAGIGYTWRADAPVQSARQTPSSTSPPAPAIPAATLDGGDAIEPAQRDALGALLLAREDFARDFHFLLAASLRDRCEPAHAHELARMAVAVGLPVLEDTRAALTEHPQLRHPAYVLVSHLAAAAPCGKTLHVAFGGFSMNLAPERYAAAFPDSYFMPGLDAPSADFGGRDLRTRVNDPCTPVVYAALPLGAERLWQCIGPRSALRKRLRDTCAGDLHGGSVADGKVTARLVDSIRGEMERLPAMCR